MQCQSNMNGIYCENGNVAVIRSEVSIVGHSAYVSETPIFGVFAGPNSAIEVVNSLFNVDFNRGIAVAGYFAWRNQPAEYDEEYTPKPKSLDGFVLDDTKQVFGLYSIFAVDDMGGAGFHVLETVFDLSSDNLPATNVKVDNR